ncbi:MAG: DegQ family serine endoprotease [Gammaproteobacteria bacterium]|nr:MAG: DegQ family serine endoprotease [Gammaproteobacteria bacterium]
METKLSNYFFCSFIVLAALVFSFNANASLPEFSDLVKENGPSVVNISTTQKKVHNRFMPKGWNIPNMPEGHPFEDFFNRFFDGQGGEREYKSKSLGSGFIISEDGYILTNNHVVDGADEILVRLSDRREYEAKIIGGDEKSDVAVLKIEENNLPAVVIGKSSDLEVGEWVLAIGSPFGFEWSATQGIVSAKGRSLPRDNYVPFIQTDVAINPGNSGGPLFNLDGEVVGINAQIYTRSGGYSGLSFSIPIELAMDVVDQIRNNGKVSRGWLGVLIQEVTYELSESFGMEKPYGAAVLQVVKDSPADKAGIQIGDVIIKYNDVTVERSGALPPMVGRTKVGTEVDVVIIRQGEKKTLEVRIEELEGGESEEDVAKKRSGVEKTIGLSLRNMTAEEKKKRKEGDYGVVVAEVGKGAGSNAGIKAGDIIKMINNKTVYSIKEAVEMLSDIDKGDVVPVLIERRGTPMFLAIKAE